LFVLNPLSSNAPLIAKNIQPLRNLKTTPFFRQGLLEFRSQGWHVEITSL
jgi:hypothetical protein